MLALLKRYRELLLVAALLVVPLGVFFAHAKRPADLSRVDRVVLAMTAPIEKVVGWTVTGALRAWQGYVDLRLVRQRATELAREVSRLQMEKQELDQVRAQNDRLRALLGFAEAEPNLKVVGARVIGVRLDPKGLQIVTVDRGTDAGIAPMMPVVTAQGIVGRVQTALSGSADVLLLVDSRSSVAVRVDRSRARANVRGTNSPDTCRLDYALRSEDILEGDTLVTAGTDGVFPRGLPVGRVAHVKRGTFGLYQQADVVPAVNVTRVEEVLVVTSRDRSMEQAPAARAGTR